MRTAMKTKCAAVVVVALAVAFLGAAIPAQDKPAANPNAKPAAAQKEKKKDEVLGQADFMRTSWGQKKTVLMRGNVRFTHGDTVITSDEVTYDQDAKVAVSPKTIKITNPECDITGDSGTAYFDDRLGVIEGSVAMLLKPKKTGEAQNPKDSNDESVREKLKKPTFINCQKLEYLYADKIATASGQVQFKQEKRSASAQTAVYDQNKELLKLTGNVQGMDEYGQTFAAPGTVLISLKEGDEWMEAEDVSASFKIDLEEEKQ